MKTKRFPLPSTPAGWFVVAWADELGPRSVLPLSYFGHELVLFRDAAGAPRVLDAHCPHLGAHLGHGGTVVDDGIRCPFHGWCFSGDGACASAAEARKIPPAARLRAWPVRERNGFILVHHHPLGDAPDVEVEHAPELASEAWAPPVRRRWTIRTNIHEMVENAFDAMHFRHLHALRNVPEPEITWSGASCRMYTETVMDTPRGPARGALDIQKLGLGYGTARFTGVVETLVFTTLTPIDDEQVDARFTFTVKKLPSAEATEAAAAGFIAELCRQIEQDIRIWEHKAYLERPLLGEMDAGIAAFRRWARQFYPTARRALDVVA
jgi:nitrite reductase/ring-hydroxylating ferredoxin subunit